MNHTDPPLTEAEADQLADMIESGEIEFDFANPIPREEWPDEVGSRSGRLS